MNITILRDILADIQQSFQLFDSQNQQNKFLELQNSQLLQAIHQTFETTDQEPHARELFLGFAEVFLSFQNPQNRQMSCTNEPIIAMICQTMQKAQNTEPSLQRHAKCLMSLLIDLLLPEYTFSKTAVLQITDLTVNPDIEVSLLGFKFAVKYVGNVFGSGTESDFQWRLAFVQVSAMVNMLLQDAVQMSYLCDSGEKRKLTSQETTSLVRSKTQILERLIYLQEFQDIKQLQNLLQQRIQQQIIYPHVLGSLRYALKETSLFTRGPEEPFSIFSPDYQQDVSPSTRAFVLNPGVSQQKALMMQIASPLTLKPQVAVYILNWTIEKLGFQIVVGDRPQLDCSVFQFEKQQVELIDYYNGSIKEQLREILPRYIRLYPGDFSANSQIFEALRRLELGIEPELTEKVIRQLTIHPHCDEQLQKLSDNLQNIPSFEKYTRAIRRDQKLLKQDIEDQIVELTAEYPDGLNRFLSENIRVIEPEATEMVDELLRCGYEYHLQQ